MTWSAPSRITKAPALIAVLGSLLIGGSAAAQTPAGVPPSANRFDLTLSLGERYSSNPTYLQDSQQPEGDTINDFRASLSARRTSERTDWAFEYLPFYTRYHTNDQLDTANHALDYRGRYLISRRSRLTLLDRFSYSRDPVRGALPETTDATVLTLQTRRWRNRSEAELESDVSRSVSLRLGALAAVDRFEEPLLVDSNTYSGRAGLVKRFGARQSLSSIYTHSRFLLGEDAAPDVNSDGVELGYSFTAGRQTAMDAAAGITRVSREGERQNLLTGSATLSHPFRRLRFTSGYRRSLSADTGTNAVTVSQSAYAGISGTAGRRLDLGAFGDYGTRESALSSGEQVSLTYVGGALRASVILNEWLHLTGEARRLDQSGSGATAEDVTVNTVYLGLDFKVFQSGRAARVP